MPHPSLFVTTTFPEIYKPCRADGSLTANIKEAVKCLDITVMHHILVSEKGYDSFADEEIL